MKATRLRFRYHEQDWNTLCIETLGQHREGPDVNFAGYYFFHQIGGEPLLQQFCDDVLYVFSPASQQ